MQRCIGVQQIVLLLLVVNKENGRELFMGHYQIPANDMCNFHDGSSDRVALIKLNMLMVYLICMKYLNSSCRHRLCNCI